MKFNPGDIVKMKKPHTAVCNSYEWEVITSKADVKLKCLNCGRLIHVPRLTLIKRVKDIRRKDDGK